MLGSRKVPLMSPLLLADWGSTATVPLSFLSGNAFARIVVLEHPGVVVEDHLRRAAMLPGDLDHGAALIDE